MDIDEGVHICQMMDFHQGRKAYYADMTRRLDSGMKLSWSPHHDINFAYAAQNCHQSEYMNWLSRLYLLYRS